MYYTSEKLLMHYKYSADNPKMLTEICSLSDLTFHPFICSDLVLDSGHSSCVEWVSDESIIFFFFSISYLVGR